MSRLLTVAASMTLLAGCATVNPRPAFDDMRKTVAERSRLDPEWSRTSEETSAAEEAVTKLLAAPLTVDAAVQVALLNNPTLQATFEEIGISQADLAQAAHVENPEISGFVRFPSEGTGRNIEFSLRPERLRHLHPAASQEGRRRRAGADEAPRRERGARARG